MSGLVFLTDESDKEEAIKAEMNEEQELGVIHSWMEVGASQPCQRRRHGGCYVRYVPSFSLIFSWFSNYPFSILLYKPSFLSFFFSLGYRTIE